MKWHFIRNECKMRRKLPKKNPNCARNLFSFSFHCHCLPFPLQSRAKYNNNKICSWGRSACIRQHLMCIQWCVFRSDSNSIKLFISSPFKMHTWLIQDKCSIVHSFIRYILTYLACSAMPSVAFARIANTDAAAANDSTVSFITQAGNKAAARMVNRFSATIFVLCRKISDRKCVSRMFWVSDAKVKPQTAMRTNLLNHKKVQNT